jgi:hypothetical protein
MTSFAHVHVRAAVETCITFRLPSEIPIFSTLPCANPIAEQLILDHKRFGWTPQFLTLHRVTMIVDYSIDKRQDWLNIGVHALLHTER